MIMPIQSMEEVIRILETRYNVNFTPVRGKKVFNDTINGERSIVVCSPLSRIHSGGQGWIDLTRIQVDLIEKYDAAAIAFRLPNRQTYYVNYQQISPLLTEDCTFFNQKEGVHWKLYIWPERIVVRQNEMALHVISNSFENIDVIFKV
jgi:hypothetical protein